MTRPAGQCPPLISRQARHTLLAGGVPKIRMFFVQKTDNFKSNLYLLKDNHGETALHLAAKNRHNVVMDDMLQWGANINAQNNMGRTTLHMTAQSNPLKDIAYYLIDMGADIKVKDSQGNTALHVATDHYKAGFYSDKI